MKLYMISLNCYVLTNDVKSIFKDLLERNLNNVKSAKLSNQHSLRKPILNSETFEINCLYEVKKNRYALSNSYTEYSGLQESSVVFEVGFPV